MQALIDFLLMLQECLKETELLAGTQGFLVSLREKSIFLWFLCQGVTYFMNLRIISSYLHGETILAFFNLGLCISHVSDLPSYQAHRGSQ